MRRLFPRPSFAEDAVSQGFVLQQQTTGTCLCRTSAYVAEGTLEGGEGGSGFEKVCYQ